jgi:hypothetical protein
LEDIALRRPRPDDNGYFPFAGAGMKWDANVTAFSVLMVFLLVSVALVLVG